MVYDGYWAWHFILQRSVAIDEIMVAIFDMTKSISEALWVL